MQRLTQSDRAKVDPIMRTAVCFVFPANEREWSNEDDLPGSESRKHDQMGDRARETSTEPASACVTVEDARAKRYDRRADDRRRNSSAMPIETDPDRAGWRQE